MVFLLKLFESPFELDQLLLEITVQNGFFKFYMLVLAVAEEFPE